MKEHFAMDLAEILRDRAISVEMDYAVVRTMCTDGVLTNSAVKTRMQQTQSIGDVYRRKGTKVLIL